MASKEECRWCGKKAASYNSIFIPDEDDYICICLQCYNREISKIAGIDYEDIQLHPVIIKDRDGVGHEFHFSLRLMGDQQVLSAFELEGTFSGGYEFSIIGETEDGIFPLFSALYARMLKALARKHIHMDDDTESWKITEKDRVRGQISSAEGSDEFSRVPLMVIDGKKISWEAFGQMLMSYQGFNFKLQIFDPSQEID